MEGKKMGACNFIVFGKGATAQETFDALVSDARFEYGHDPYNGTISTTYLTGRPVRVADEWCEDVRELAIIEADANEWGEKREARAIDCGACGDGLRMWAFYGWASC